MADDELLDYTESQHTTTSQKKTVNISSFTDLLLKQELINAIKDANLEHPSEIQSVTIPKAVLGADVLCQGKSGTGKTVVFVISSLQRLQKDQKPNIPGEASQLKLSPQILVIANTKEMAVQIHSEYTRFSKYLGINILSFYGGVDVSLDEERIRSTPSCEVVIGTAGRILDMAEREILDLSNLRIFIADEVDHLISTPGHRWTIQKIFYRTPVQKQTMMFSATLTEEVKVTLLQFLRSPFVLEVNAQKNLTLHGLDQGYVNVTNEKKDQKLVDLIDKISEISQCVIFCADKMRCKSLEKFLVSQGLPTISITSEYSTEERMNRFNQFKSFNYRFLVTTNLMARGIDIAEINLVVNYDMPRDANTYLHRVGRAGRFETRGIAISFISSEEDIIVLNEVQERFDVSVKEIK